MLAFAWLAVVAMPAFEACCETLAAICTDTDATCADEHGDRVLTPREALLASYLDLDGAAPVQFSR